MKEICVKVTFHFEDGSDKAVDAQRVARAVRHGFPYALGGEIDVEEIEEYKGKVIPTPLGSLRRQAALAAALNDACDFIRNDLVTRDWRELLAAGGGAVEGGWPKVEAGLAAPSKKAFNDGIERAIQVLSIESITPKGSPTLGQMIDAIRREKK